MYQYLLFDLDGTLTDSAEGIINCVQYALEKMGAEKRSREELRVFVGPPLSESFKNVCGFSEEEAKQAEDDEVDAIAVARALRSGEEE